MSFKEIDVENFHCEICEFAKHHYASFPISNKNASIHFSLIHSDIWGPSIVSNILEARWFVSFIDDFTIVSWIILRKKKSNVSNVFSNFHNIIKTQFCVRIKKFKSKMPKVYFDEALSPYFKKELIVYESSCVSTPPQNGVAKRKNGHLLVTTRAFLLKKMFQKTIRRGNSNGYLSYQ